MEQKKDKQETNQNNYEDLSNVEAEIALIGCILRENRYYEKISDFLLPEHFTNPLHLKLFSIISKKINQNLPVSPITLKDYFSSSKDDYNIEVFEYLKQIKDSAPSMINAFNYGKIIYDLHLRRSLVTLGKEITDKAYVKEVEKDGIVQIEEAEENLFNLSQKGALERKYMRLGDALKDAISTLDAAYKKDSKITGIPTGISDLDKKLGGLHNSDLIIIAGRPSMGKTALGTTLAFNISKSFTEEKDEFGSLNLIDGGKVAIFSLEMSSQQLATRILASQSNISSDKMRRAEFSKEDLKNIYTASGEIENLNLFIDDNPMLTVSALRTRARRLYRQHNINLIIIDYLQLMSGSNQNRNDGRVQEISEITRGLKSVAKELNIPIIALSQLSRQVEQREDKRPLLSDLRESGTIEQDSDVVIFIYRESYYLERSEPIRKPDEDEDRYQLRYQRWKELAEQSHNIAELIISKQRHGPIGTIKTQFDADLTKFSNLARNNYENIE
tara:strand:+ start:18968 stop:20470 length:1503 start_codon:yes stop_codon:yes gene_type:complete